MANEPIDTTLVLLSGDEHAPTGSITIDGVHIFKVCVGK